MDLASFYAEYREDGWGGAAHNPKTMVALLVYAYCLSTAWVCDRPVRSSGPATSTSAATRPPAPRVRIPSEGLAR